MTEKFSNELTAAEAERLAILAEECAEVIVIVGKILRHGFESYDPTKPEIERRTNRALLADELGDLAWIKNQMASMFRDVDAAIVQARFLSGGRRKARWLHHQGDAVFGRPSSENTGG